MAQLNLLAAAAGAGIIAACPGQSLLEVFLVFHRQQGHDFSRGAALAQQRGHDLHRPVDVVEERFVPGAEIVQPWLAVWGVVEAVFGAAAVAGKTHLTGAAGIGQAVQLVLAKLPLPV